MTISRSARRWDTSNKDRLREMALAAVEERAAYTRSRMECMGCGMTWNSIHQLGCDDIECPRCGSKNSVRV